MKKRLIILWLTSIIVCLPYSPCSAEWLIKTIDTNQHSGQYSSIAIDSSDFVHIGYYEADDWDAKYATNRSGSWTTEIVNWVGIDGLYLNLSVDKFHDIHMVYRDGTSHDVIYTSNKSGAWVHTIIGDTGTWTSIANDSLGNAHVAYYYYNSSYDDLYYTTNKSGSWTTQTIDSPGNVGTYASIAVDSTDKVHISYYDTTNTNLKYATNSSGSWQTYTVDNIGDVGQYTSIALDRFDNVHISYYDVTNKNLKHAYKPPLGSWTIETIDTVGDVGQWSSIALGSDGYAHISYYDVTNTALKYATNQSGTWINEVVDNAGVVGAYTSIDLNSFNTVYISYYDETNGALKLAQQLHSLKILSPNGDEALTKGQEYTISWNSTVFSGNVKIDLYKGGNSQQFFVQQLAAAAPNTGTYPFSPPIYLASGNDYLIGISVENGTVFDFSDGYFSIQSEYDSLPESFAFSTINSPQSVDTPFSVTITAKKADGNLLTGYNGTVMLSSNLSAVNPTSVKLENGQKTFTVTLDTPGNVQLTCEANGVSGQSNTFSVTAVNPCSGSFTGKVIDNNGDVVFNANVSVYDSQGQPISSTQTDINGIYKFTGLDCNQYELRVEKNGVTKNGVPIDIAGNQADKIGNVELTLNPGTRGTPVILVPGILGSSSKYGVIYPRLPSQKPARGLHIHDPYIPDFSIGLVRRATGFTELKEYLSSSGFNVFDCPWDWRLLAQKAYPEYLIPKIDEAMSFSTTGKVHIVAHSMGGLLVRSYIQGGNYRGDIDKFVMVGTPNLGSCNPYYIWEGGDPKLLDDIIDPKWGLKTMVNFYANTLQQLWEETYKQKGWSVYKNKEIREFVRWVAPSLLQLMNTKDDFLFSTFYGTSWGTSTPGNVNTWLNNLNSDQNIPNLMDKDGADGKIHVGVIAGYSSESTIERIKCGSPRGLYEDGGLVYPAKRTVSWGLGDGTVPYESAKWPAAQQWADLLYLVSKEVSGDDTDHASLIRNQEVQHKIFDFLSGDTPVKSFTIKLSEFQAESITSSLYISVNGAVRTCVTDPSGNKSGVDPVTGDIVEQIAGSETYFRFSGGEVEIKNPTQGSYSVTIFGDQEKDYQLEVGYLNSQSNQLISLQGFNGAIPTSFQLVLNPSSQPAVGIVPSVNSPTGAVAEPYSSNGTELTRIRWNQSSTPGVVSYNIYSAADVEPYFKKIASVPAGQSAYDLTHPWSYDPSATLRVYAITAVTDTGAESFFSEVVQNNDRDNDKLSDWDEAALGTNPTSPDTDGDGLADGEEVRIGTNPLMADSDNDGYSDAEELTKGSNPLDPNSIPTFTGDMDYDCDVDGKDLALLISESQVLVDEQKLSTFAAAFGRTDCP
jgi:pimeloyl-ACP methyl ester carboxylesterase